MATIGEQIKIVLHVLVEQEHFLRTGDRPRFARDNFIAVVVALHDEIALAGTDRRGYDRADANFPLEPGDNQS